MQPGAYAGVAPDTRFLERRDMNQIVPPFLAASAYSMIDPFGRTITYLRMSVTNRCDFRCIHCMTEDTTLLPRRNSSH